MPMLTWLPPPLDKMDLNPRLEKPPTPLPPITAIDRMEQRPMRPERPDKPSEMQSAPNTPTPVATSWFEKMEQKAKLGRTSAPLVGARGGLDLQRPERPDRSPPSLPPIFLAGNDDVTAIPEMPISPPPDTPPVNVSPKAKPESKPSSMESQARFSLFPSSTEYRRGSNAALNGNLPGERRESNASTKKANKANTTSMPPGSIFDKLVADINPARPNSPLPSPSCAPSQTSSTYSSLHDKITTVDTTAQTLPPPVQTPSRPNRPSRDSHESRSSHGSRSSRDKDPEKTPLTARPLVSRIDSKDMLNTQNLLTIAQPTPPPDKPLPKIPGPMKNLQLRAPIPSYPPPPASRPAVVQNSTLSFLRSSGLPDLKIIGVQEHIAIPHLQTRFPDDLPRIKAAKNQQSHIESLFPYTKSRLADVSDQRIKDMDDNGIAFQIVSRSALVNPLSMEAGAGTALTRQLNDELKWAVDENPKRFAALAELPFQSPELAVRELRRCVLRLGFVGVMLHGTIGGKFLDDPIFDEILGAFEELDVPIFLHPGTPDKNVVDAYYSFDGKPDQLSAMLAGPGFGWHNEVAVHVLRLAISGTLDRHPKLKVIVGHQGEMLPMMLHRFDSMFNPTLLGLERSVSQMLRQQVWISISGLFSMPVTTLTIQTWGVEKILFANDYPLVEADTVPDFVRRLGDMVAPSDLKKIMQTNAEALFKFKADECGRTRSNRKWTMIL